MGTTTVQSRTTTSTDEPDGTGLRRCLRKVVSGVVTATAGLTVVGLASAQSAGGGSSVSGGGSGLYLTVAALALSTLAVAAVYLFSWRERPERTFTPGQATTERVPNRHTGRMLEADVSSRETETVDHDAFDPVGTAAFIAMYFLVIALAWLFMYFVEFLANGPSVVS